MPADFHEVRFPLDVALGAKGGPGRATQIVTLGSGFERRNARWAHSRRRYDAGYGVKSLDALSAVLAFFEERRGMLYGFRWRDRFDFKSCEPGGDPGPLDQRIGTGDGASTSFRLAKRYGERHAPYERPVTKPVAGSVRVALDGVEALPGSGFSLDAATGTITFAAGRAPRAGVPVTAGFLFDVPVRFDTDRLEVDLSAFEAGVIPHIPLTEILV